MTERLNKIPGEPGIWFVILGDIVIFTVLFGLYLFFRADHPGLFEAAQSRLTVGFGILDSVLLITSSLAVVGGTNAARARDSRNASRFFAIAIALGTAFVISKGIEWGIKVDHDLVPKTNDFWMLYYGLTGMHLFHVFLGLFILWLVRRMANRGMDGPYDRVLLEGGAAFWHMVDLLWLVLFATVYFIH
jgi:nitric oxide reductase NorE protein